MKRELLAVVGLGLLTAAPLLAQEAGQDAGQKPADKAKEEETVRRSEEVTVESASKVETKLIDAPATMSVVTSEALAASPAQNMADALRSIPGMNVIQTSARDINLTARQATSTLATSQLVLVDGRSVYLDFFGLVLWDFVPTAHLRRHQADRGRARSGLRGVGGERRQRRGERHHEDAARERGLRARPRRRAVQSRRRFPGERRLRLPVQRQLLLRERHQRHVVLPPERRLLQLRPLLAPVRHRCRLDCHPMGAVPCRSATGAALPGGVPIGGATFPADTDAPGAFENDGTSQPKVDLRLDQDFENGGRITYQGGYASTQGIVHTGIGPFGLQSGSYMAYGKAALHEGQLCGSGLSATSWTPRRLTCSQSDPDTLGPIILGFKTETYDLEVGNTNVLGESTSSTYGGNFRRNNCDISLAQARHGLP